MSGRLKRMLCCLAVASLIVMPVSAKESGGVEKKGVSQSPSALKILDRAYGYLESLKSFKFKAVTDNEDIYLKKMRVTLTHEVEVELKRPDKLMVDISGNVKNRRYYLNGKNFVMIDKKRGYYGELEVPQGVDAALDYLFEKYDIKTPLANLLYSDLKQRILPKKEGVYFGSVTVDGTICDYIGFRDKYKELQVWISKGDEPLIRKFVLIDKGSGKSLRSSTTIEWSTKEDISDDEFVFKAPEGSVKISVESPRR